MIQILGLRPFFNEKKQKWDVTDNTFFKRGWRSPSVIELFANLDQHLAKIPEKERYNLFYTVANCAEGKREFRDQSVIVFDVDKLEEEAKTPGPMREKYISLICETLGVKREETGIVFSGNGLHFIIGLEGPIADATFFEENRRHYQAVLTKLEHTLRGSGLQGEPDPAVFDPRRIMRLPGTLNRKDGKPERLCELLQPHVAQVAFDLTARSGLPAVEPADHIHAQTLRKFPTPDTKAVLSGCEFLKWCKTSPNEVSEEQWYASLSILPRLEDGKTLAHEYSQGHRGYSQAETDAKIEQALEASGPRTCKNINKIWGKCSGCPHFEKVTSPIMIRDPDSIKTQHNGFHELVQDAKGNLKPGRPCYEDLRKFFLQQSQYVVLGESKICLVWTGKFWREMKDTYLENFAQTHFNPTATTAMTQEFKNLVCRTNLKDTDWFIKTTNRKINFNNGVLDLDTMEFVPHSPEFGFRYCLSYDYDPSAAAPRFQTFLNEVMQGKQDLVSVLLEYAGYSFSNDTCWAQKSLIMTGVGANGKSTFMNVLKALAGKENYASLTLSDLKNETARQQIDGKLFNLAEETPTYSMIDSSLFKNLSSGGETMVKVLYKQPYTIANKCKFMFACNELPKSRDTTKGFFRRLLIVPFNQTFEGEKKDSFIEEKLLQELPGIFNLVVEGYRRLKKKKAFTGSSEIDDQVREYRLDLDSVASWLDMCVVVGEYTDQSPGVSLSKLYTAYSFFTQNRGEKPEPYSVFSKRLQQQIAGYANRNYRKMIDGKKETLVRGVQYGEASQF